MRFKKNKYLIKYPSIGCSGQWELKKSTINQLEFIEIIEIGKDICNNKGWVVLKKINDNEIDILYYWPDQNTLNAKGMLKRK